MKTKRFAILFQFIGIYFLFRIILEIDKTPTEGVGGFLLPGLFGLSYVILFIAFGVTAIFWSRVESKSPVEKKVFQVLMVANVLLSLPFVNFFIIKSGLHLFNPRKYWASAPGVPGVILPRQIPHGCIKAGGVSLLEPQKIIRIENQLLVLENKKTVRPVMPFGWSVSVQPKDRTSWAFFNAVERQMLNKPVKFTEDCTGQPAIPLVAFAGESANEIEDALIKEMGLNMRALDCKKTDKKLCDTLDPRSSGCFYMAPKVTYGGVQTLDKTICQQFASSHLCKANERVEASTGFYLKRANGSEWVELSPFKSVCN